jgi:hypothetical protein
MPPTAVIAGSPSAPSAFFPGGKNFILTVRWPPSSVCPKSKQPGRLGVPRLVEDAVARPGAEDREKAVFSSGSIAWGQALPANNFDNNVARIMSNLIEAFVKDGMLPGSLWVSEEKQWR